MKKAYLSLITTTALFTFSSYAQAEKNIELYEHGQEAHEAHCNKCHTDAVYTRKNRFVKSMDALSKQVKRCKEGNSIAWFDEDVEAVAHFINEKYYKF